MPPSERCDGPAGDVTGRDVTGPAGSWQPGDESWAPLTLSKWLDALDTPRCNTIQYHAIQWNIIQYGNHVTRARLLWHCQKSLIQTQAPEDWKYVKMIAGLFLTSFWEWCWPAEQWQWWWRRRWMWGCPGVWRMTGYNSGVDLPSVAPVDHLMHQFSSGHCSF